MSDSKRASLPGHEWLAAHGTVLERWHVNTTPFSPSRSNLYAKLNALIAQEVGEDMGAELPGPDWIKRK